MINPPIQSFVPQVVKFCTEHSAAVGEPLPGTGGHQAKMVLIQWPKAKWRYSLRLAEGMGKELADAVETVFKAGWRVNLIDRKAEDVGKARVFVFPDALSFDLAPADVPEFLDLLPVGIKAVEHFGASAIAVPLILCCTHGKHDRCCAKFGFGLYKAIQAKAGCAFDVWECTHLGGCRLSASVLTLPAMRKYGRLLPSDVEALLAAEAQDRPHLPNYRGAAHLRPIEQVAEVAALQEAAKDAVFGSASVREASATNQHTDFLVSIATRTVLVRCTPSSVEAYGACSDLQEKAPLNPKTTWHAEVLARATSLEGVDS